MSLYEVMVIHVLHDVDDLGYPHAAGLHHDGPRAWQLRRLSAGGGGMGRPLMSKVYCQVPGVALAEWRTSVFFLIFCKGVHFA